MPKICTISIFSISIYTWEEDNGRSLVNRESLYVITELLRKQIDAEFNIIYANLYDFVKKFFNEETAELIGDLEYLVYFGPSFLYVQQHWIDENGENCVLELDVDYKDYNKWLKGLSE